MPEQTLSKDYVTRVLTTVDAPDGPTAGQDLVTAGILQWISACDGYASVRLSLPEAGDAPADQTAMVHLAGEADRAIRAAARRDGIAVNDLRFIFVDHSGNIVFRAGKGPDDPDAAPAGAESGQDHALPQRGAQQQPNRPPDRPQATANALPGVKKIVAVGAGKGGVGKSSVAVNLAVGLARAGHAVGLLDGDIYGPSLPTMLGLDSHEQAVMDGKLVPHAVHGVKAVTIGKLVEPEKPLIWRGPMAHGAFQQLTTRTAWGELDYLVIDLPPGTGDIVLTMAQSLQLTGAVVVCTPQKVAQDDAVRAARMFQQLGVEVLGVVENMSYFVGDDGKEYDIFGRGGAEAMAQRLGLPFLGSVPINTSLRENSDTGDPTRNFEEATAGGAQLPVALGRLVQNLESQVALASLRSGGRTPSLTIS